jgi:hypothetical protein
MSVVVMTKIPVQVTDLERVAKEQGDLLTGVGERAKALGCLHHQFVEAGDGTTLVIDEWTSEDAFHTFFDGETEIRTLLEAAGATGPPSSSAHRILDTPDRF